MASVTDTTTHLTCPNPKCKKDLVAKVSEILSRGKISCTRCGSEIIFSSGSISNLRGVIAEIDGTGREVEQAKQEYERAKTKFDQKMKQLEGTKTKLSKAVSQIESTLQYKIKG